MRHLDALAKALDQPQMEQQLQPRDRLTSGQIDQPVPTRHCQLQEARQRHNGQHLLGHRRHLLRLSNGKHLLRMYHGNPLLRPHHRQHLQGLHQQQRPLRLPHQGHQQQQQVVQVPSLEHRQPPPLLRQTLAPDRPPGQPDQQVLDPEATTNAVLHIYSHSVVVVVVGIIDRAISPCRPSRHEGGPQPARGGLIAANPPCP